MVDDVVRRYASFVVPRYTSYPTAANFSDAITSDDHARWLRCLDGRENISIYLHVPSCRELCLAGDCHRKSAHSKEMTPDYRLALEQEIDLVADQMMMMTTPRIARLQWGARNASILGPHGMSSILEALARRFSFNDDFEHGIGLDPRQVDRGLAQSLAGLGINRANLDLRGIEPQMETTIGLTELLEPAAEHLRTAGIGTLEFRLTYGIPLQTEASLEKSCVGTCELRPDRVTCSDYDPPPCHSANATFLNEPFLLLTEERLRQAQVVARTFVNQGFVAVGIDHFTKPQDPLAAAARDGRLRRNLHGYTDDADPVLMSFGASAISQLPDGFVQNASDVVAYCGAIAAGRLASVRGRALSETDIARALIIQDLMCNFRVDLGRFGSDFADELALLRPLAVDGMLTIDRRIVTMTEAGRAVAGLAASVFDQYRREGTGSLTAVV